MARVWEKGSLCLGFLWPIVCWHACFKSQPCLLKNNLQNQHKNNANTPRHKTALDHLFLFQFSHKWLVRFLAFLGLSIALGMRIKMSFGSLKMELKWVRYGSQKLCINMDICWASACASELAWSCMDSTSWPPLVSLVTSSILNQMMWFKAQIKDLMAYFKMHEVDFSNSIWIKRYELQDYAHHLFVKSTRRESP